MGSYKKQSPIPLDMHRCTAFLSSNSNASLVSRNPAILILDNSSANFVLTSSCVEETSLDATEVGLMFLPPFAYVMDIQVASSTDTIISYNNISTLQPMSCLKHT